MKRIILLFAILSAILLAGCSSAKHAVEIAEHSIHDTLYLNKVQYDSIYINDGYAMDFHPSKEFVYLLDSMIAIKVDTMYIHDKQLEYKHKFLHDTTYVHKVDTIPIIKTVEVTKTERYVPSIYKWSLGIVITLLITLILYIVWKIKF